MPISVSDSGGGSFKQLPAGTHVARCIRLIDLGTQEGEYQGEKHYRRQVQITWEVPGELNDDGQPMIVSGWYTASLGEKAKLRHILETWRGRQFTKEELRRFELSAVLGQPAMLAVTHNANDRARVEAVAKLPKGTTCPPAVNATLLLSLDRSEYDPKVYEALSPKMREMIAKSPEWQELQVPDRELAQPALPESIADMDDDIPF